MFFRNDRGAYFNYFFPEVGLDDSDPEQLADIPKGDNGQSDENPLEHVKDRLV